MWLGSGECDEACGGGQTTRTRLCDSPVASNGGLACLVKNAADDNDRHMVEEDFQDCNTDECGPGMNLNHKNLIFCASAFFSQ